VFAGSTVQGSARLDASWKGGWQAVQRRLQIANEPAPRGAAEPTLQATLSVPKLELTLPPSEPGPSSTVQLNGVRADVAGSLAQATLELKGEAVAGGRKIGLDARASGGIERPNQWNAAIASLRVQVLEARRRAVGAGAR
jgi:translocation and assembly module TamB